METILVLLSVFSVSIIVLYVVVSAMKYVYLWMRSHDNIDAANINSAEEDRAWDRQLDDLDDTRKQNWINAVAAGRTAFHNAKEEGKTETEAIAIRDRVRTNYLREMQV